MVIDFAVERDDGIPIIAGHRLVAAVQVDDLQPDRAQDRTAAARALSELLGEIDDIARATLGSVTIATMLKLVDRHRKGGRQTGVRSAPPA